MLEVRGLALRAGDFALGEIDLRVARGACHVVLGPSGAGKSTLLDCVLGLRRPDRGQVRLDGRDLTGLPIERRGLGYVPQRLALFPHLTVAENIAYSARARGVAPGVAGPLTRRLVDSLGIGHLLARRPATLSGGESQRVALARALAAGPRAVLLDEPFTALNESLRRELWWLLKDLQAERELTVLMITHDLAEAWFLADHITVLIDGRQRQSAPKGRLYRRPASADVARLLGIKNLFPARVLDGGRVHCPALGGALALDQRPLPPPGTPVQLGIRAEHVALRFADHPNPDGERRLAGRFTAVLEMGDSALLHFRPEGSDARLEIRLGDRLLRKFRPAVGGEGLVGLSPHDLFVVDS